MQKEHEMSKYAYEFDRDHGYRIAIEWQLECDNPLKEWDGMPTLVLHERAERHFGWTTDAEWGQRLNGALRRLQEGRWCTSREQALEAVSRWLRVYHGVPVVLPVSAMEHSGTTVHLGDGAHWIDPGGWDSGWVGWLFYAPGTLLDRALAPGLDEAALRSGFASFAAYISGDVYRWVALDPRGEEIESVGGYYGDARLDEMKAEAQWAIDRHWDAEREQIQGL
jgi:hypothetical protein